MELKEAMEAATADLDVRPGFVGDVMAGARRRHTRKLLAVTAAVALLAGVTTGVLLTRSAPDPPVAGADDPRLTAATGGDLAGNAEFIQHSLAVWTRGTTIGNLVTDVSPDAHVFWAGNTQDGRVALIAQSARVSGSAEPETLVGLVNDDTLVDQAIVRPGPTDTSMFPEQGIYRLGGDENATYVVLSLGQKVFWSASPVRGPDLRYSRQWHEVPFSDGVAVVAAKPAENPVFVRTGQGPPADVLDGEEKRILPRQEFGDRVVARPHTGYRWPIITWASSKQNPDEPGTGSGTFVSTDLKRRGYLDYDLPQRWEVRAWLPDGRYAVVTQTNKELLGAVYRADGTFDRALSGGLATKGTPVPVRLVLPDDQGIILADHGALIGPEERENAWLAPPGTTQVTIWRNGDQTVVPLQL